MSNLDTYIGPFGKNEASHLLSRCTFGSTKEIVDNSVALGFEASIDVLFQPTEVGPPLYHDPESQYYGLPWRQTPQPGYEDSEIFRRSVIAWLYKNVIEEGMSINEKMRLFWQSHFCVSQQAISNANYISLYFEKLKEYSLGNFKEFVKEISIDPGMLKFLSGQFNTVDNPNENYARELLELFTLGKGPIVGPGDYTTYTEHDIKEITKILSGWVAHHYTDDDGLSAYKGRFLASRHDTSQKILSHRFEEAIIDDMGELECNHLIDLIFSTQPITIARFICTKLYIFFVNSNIDEEVKDSIIHPLADYFVENDFELLPVVKKLLMSNHFFDSCNVGTMIKSPIDYHARLMKQVGFPHPEGLLEDEYSGWLFFDLLNRKQLMYYAWPTNVAGWKPYYQAPDYNRLWINADSLQKRKRNITYFTHNATSWGHTKSLLVGPLLAKFDDPGNPLSLVEEMVGLYFARPLNSEQILFLKNILLSPVNEDYYWTDIYSLYLIDPANSENTDIMVEKVRDLLYAMFVLPEYQLM